LKKINSNSILWNAENATSMNAFKKINVLRPNQENESRIAENTVKTGAQERQPLVADEVCAIVMKKTDA
jgi:hypothetical protein